MSQPINTIGIDLAKNTFQVCAADSKGNSLFNKAIKRQQMNELISNTPPCTIVLEACATAHHWARVFANQGHIVKLIHPAYVRPFVKSNKNDSADAEALIEAASRPNMRFVQPKTVEQQDILLLHRQRERLVRQRTALGNQTRGLLAEYGIVIPVGIMRLRSALPDILEDASNHLSPTARRAFSRQYRELIDIWQRIDEVKAEINAHCRALESCQRLTSIPGVGPMTATALVATMGNHAHYRNGREFAAFLGLVPRQYSSGGKTVLKGISKRGDTSMRTLLIQGAQAALCRMHTKGDRMSRWATSLKQRKGTTVAVVALANKMARIAWALMASGQSFQKQAV